MLTELLHLPPAEHRRRHQLLSLVFLNLVFILSASLLLASLSLLASSLPLSSGNRGPPRRRPRRHRLSARPRSGHRARASRLPPPRRRSRRVASSGKEGRLARGLCHRPHDDGSDGETHSGGIQLAMLEIVAGELTASDVPQ